MKKQFLFLFRLCGFDPLPHPAQEPPGKTVLPGSPPEIARRDRFIRKREREEIPFQRLPEIGKIRRGETLAGQDDFINIVRRILRQRGADRGKRVRAVGINPALTASPSILICNIPFSPHSSKPRPSGQPGQA